MDEDEEQLTSGFPPNNCLVGLIQLRKRLEVSGVLSDERTFLEHGLDVFHALLTRERLHLGH